MMNAADRGRERERGVPFARDDSFVRLAMNLVSNIESKLWWGVGQPNEKSCKPRATSCCQLHRHWILCVLSYRCISHSRRLLEMLHETDAINVSRILET